MRLASIDLLMGTILVSQPGKQTPSPPPPQKKRVQLTNVTLLQKRQRIDIGALASGVEHVDVAEIVDVGASKELDGGADDAGDEEDEQDEGEQHHEPGEQLALRNVGDFDEDEDEGERADGDAVGHDPGRKGEKRECVSGMVLILMLLLLFFFFFFFLLLASWVVTCKDAGGSGTNHGIPSPMRSWICMNCALMPKMVLAVTIITMVQMLSCRSGQ